MCLESSLSLTISLLSPEILYHLSNQPPIVIHLLLQLLWLRQRTRLLLPSRSMMLSFVLISRKLCVFSTSDLSHNVIWWLDYYSVPIVTLMEGKRMIPSLGWVPQSRRECWWNLLRLLHHTLNSLLRISFSMISSTVKALYALLRLKIKMESINARNMGLLVWWTIFFLPLFRVSCSVSLWYF